MNAGVYLDEWLQWRKGGIPPTGEDDGDAEGREGGEKNGREREPEGRMGHSAD